MAEDNSQPQQSMELEKEIPQAESETGSGGTTEKKEKPRFEKPRTILSWDAPSRYFEPKSPTYFTTLFALTAAVALILFVLCKDPLLAIAAVGIGFVLFALNKYEPPLVSYELLNTGIRVQGKDYEWEKLESFFIKEGKTMPILKIKTWLVYPSELEIQIPKDKQETIETELLRHIVYREEKKGDLAQSLDNVIETFPLNSNALIPRALRSLAGKLSRKKK
ncbi:hypothetical protein B5M47_03835 [candidate division CPR3 bacterium 4484_211]|uniref:DUF5673 domain-containing protein n=1 Tax=candidate division CPR3 bacterium 4484_211 TaxID=1968527 RepID=A0A1W9NWL2_UNCC3|nr:MAG: hypothetical protein B5M47_03835 [candidate division CPR3 bacterium 4484_211]